MIDALLEPDTEKYITCDLCGNEIYEGDEYWLINGECHCEDCKDEYINSCKCYYEPNEEL